MNMGMSALAMSVSSGGSGIRQTGERQPNILVNFPHENKDNNNELDPDGERVPGAPLNPPLAKQGTVMEFQFLLLSPFNFKLDQALGSTQGSFCYRRQPGT